MSLCSNINDRFVKPSWYCLTDDVSMDERWSYLLHGCWSQWWCWKIIGLNISFTVQESNTILFLFVCVYTVANTSAATTQPTTTAAATTTAASPPTTTPGVTYSVGGGCPVPQGGFGICPSNCGPGRNCTLPKLCCAQACGGQDCVNPCAVLQCPKSCSSYASDGAGCPTCTCARKYWLQNICWVSSILWRNFSYLLELVLIERSRTRGWGGGGGVGGGGWGVGEVEVF